MSSLNEGQSFESVLMQQLLDLRTRLVAEHRRQVQLVLNQSKPGQAAKSTGQTWPMAWDTSEVREIEVGSDADDDIERSHLAADKSLIIDDAQSDHSNFKEHLETLELLPDAPVVKENPEPPLSKPPVIATLQVQPHSSSIQQTSGMLQSPAAPVGTQPAPLGTPRPSLPDGSEGKSLSPSGDRNSVAEPCHKTASQTARIAVIRRAATPDMSSRSGTPEQENNAYDIDSEGSELGENKAVVSGERGSIDSCADSGVGVTRFASMLSENSVCSQGDSPHYEVLSIWLSRKAQLSETAKKAVEQKVNVFEEPQDEDDHHHSNMAHCMIAPGTSKHIAWDAAGLLLIGCDCFLIPLQWFNPASNPVSVGIGWITRIYWTLNMIASLLIGYIDSQGTVQVRPAQVARKYMMTWLPFDLLTVGSDWAEFATDAESNLVAMGSTLRSLRMLRTIRLFRLLKALLIWRYFTEQIRSVELILVAELCKMMILMLMAAHFIACGWYGLGEAGFDDSWLEAAENQDIREKDLALRYMTSVHWSLSVFAGGTVITGKNLPEKVYTCMVLFCCFIFAASLVSSITTAMTRLEIMSRQQSQQLMQLRRYLVDNSISWKLSVRVQRNALHRMMEDKRNLQESKVELLKLISDPLLVELHFETHATVLMEHPFFCCFNEINPAGIRKVCHVAVSLLAISAGDILFSDGETPTHLRMFFPVHGQITYTPGSNTNTGEADVNGGELMMLHPDQWMCEGVLWTSWSHCGTLQAKSESRLLVIDALYFHEICATAPMTQLARYAEAFVEVLNMTDKEAHSDVGSFDFTMEDMIAYAFPELIYEQELEGGRNSHTEGSSDRSSFKLRSATNHNLAALVRQKQSQSRIERIKDAVGNVAMSIRQFASRLFGRAFKGQHSGEVNRIRVCPAAPLSDKEQD